MEETHQQNTPEQPRPEVEAPVSNIPHDGENMGAEAPEAEKSGIGPAIGIVIIIAILFFGGLYFWGAQLNNAQNDNDVPLILGDDISGFETLPDSASQSNDPEAIEEDFNTTDLDALESELNADLGAIDAEL